MNTRMRFKRKAVQVPQITSPIQAPILDDDVSSQSSAGHNFSRVQIHASEPETMQTKLMVNQPGDVYEQEAERVAEQVIQMEAPGPSESQAAQLRANDLLTRKGARDTSVHEATSAQPLVDEALSNGGGQPLDENTRSFMEPRFGHDFSRVRIHTDERAAESARSVNALAYTVGQDVVFGAGQYTPSSGSGQRLLAHELTHVIQQDLGHQTDLLVQRQVVAEPKEAETREARLSLEGAVRHNLDIQLAIIGNLDDALKNFERVARSASAKESEPKSLGTIAIEEVAKFVMDKLIETAVEDIPGGKIVTNLGKSILEKVEDEKQRAEKAAEEHALLTFIVNLQEKISKVRGDLLDERELIINETVTDYNKLDNAGQQKLHDYLVSINLELHQFRTQQATSKDLFQMIVEKWIEKTLKKEGELAKVVIVLDKDWNVKSAHIHAPYGQRLAEQLKKDGGGKVNLDTLKVTRVVRFVPEEGALFSLPAAEAVLGPDGEFVEGPRAYTNIAGARQYVAIFEENLRQRGLPETSILTGD